MIRGGRLAAVGFITGGLTAIPINFLLTGLSVWEHLLALLVLALGVTCLLVDWEKENPRTLYLIAVFATLITATASVVSTYAFGINYAFVALVVAVAAPFRVMLLALGLITVSLFGSSLIGHGGDAGSLTFAVICAPTLLVMALLAYELTRKLERSRQAFWTMSREDELTGIGNYRALIEELSTEIARHDRHERRLALILLDLDRFKEVNDVHGHPFGDRVLIRVAQAISRSVRRDDSVFRQGGDEFAVVAPETGADQLTPVIERLNGHVAACGAGEVQLSTGVGVAVYPEDGVTAEQLLSAADERLMRPKRSRDELQLPIPSEA